MIAISSIAAALLQSPNRTIANVAQPYMQGGVSASHDEITRVPTSRRTAALIMTAPVGWLAARFGRNPLYTGCIAGFTITSMLCGAGRSLSQIVTFRLLQDLFSTAPVPVTSDSARHPPARVARLRHADLGTGVMIGPNKGPTPGGYLTEHYARGGCSAISRGFV